MWGMHTLTIGIVQCLCVIMVAVVAVTMLCGRAGSHDNQFGIIPVLGFVLGVVGAYKSGFDLRDYDMIPTYVTPVFGQDFASLMRTVLIVEVVTNSMYIISPFFLSKGAG